MLWLVKEGQKAVLCGQFSPSIFKWALGIKRGLTDAHDKHLYLLSNLTDPLGHILLTFFTSKTLFVFLSL